VRAIALGGLAVFVCLSMILGIFVLVRVVMFVLPSSLTEFRIITDVLRVVLAVVLAYAWLRLWKMITDSYFWRSIGAVKIDRDEP
jgi:hypothetical protein